jgi:hypothetical protein
MYGCTYVTNLPMYVCPILRTFIGLFVFCKFARHSTIDKYEKHCNLNCKRWYITSLYVLQLPKHMSLEKMWPKCFECLANFQKLTEWRKSGHTGRQKRL